MRVICKDNLADNAKVKPHSNAAYSPTKIKGPARKVLKEYSASTKRTSSEKYIPSTTRVKDIENYIIIKKSTIPKAGKGVFSTINIPNDSLIGIYKGKKYTKKIEGDYVLQLANGKYLDAQDPDESNWTRYINDAFNSSYKNNAVFTPNGKVRLIRKVKAGGEIFVSYGNDYWQSK